MAKTADKPSRSSSSPAGVTKKSTKSKPVAAAAKKTMKTNPMAAIKNSLKGKAPLAAGKSKSAASSSSSGKGSSAAKKSDANIVSSVCRQANEVLGKDLDSKKVSGLAVKGMVEPVCRMLGKDYGVDSPKSLALAMVILADANLLTDPVRMKQLGLAAFTDPTPWERLTSDQQLKFNTKFRSLTPELQAYSSKQFQHWRYRSRPWCPPSLTCSPNWSSSSQRPWAWSSAMAAWNRGARRRSSR